MVVNNYSKRTNFSVGIDAEDIKRFKKIKKGSRFLSNNFTLRELNYCFSYKDFVSRLAGTFAAKEAVFKALGRGKIPLFAIEIVRDIDGKPQVWIKNNSEKSISISISHTATVAVAIAIKK